MKRDNNELSRNVTLIYQNDLLYPPELKVRFGDQAPKCITSLGNKDILKQKKLAFFCSVKCPGDLIVKTYDMAQAIRDAGITIIGGFQSPMECECLNILVRGSQSVIVCPARSIRGMHLRAEYKKSLAEGRMLFLSPFSEKSKRPTVEKAKERNRFVEALSNAVFVAYATPNSKTELLCHEVLSAKKPLYMLKGEANIKFFDLGARPLYSGNVRESIDC